MTDARRVAGLLGPTSIAIAISEAMNLRTLANTPAPVGLVYLNGTLLFVAGLAIVRDHNRWKSGWPVLVTLMGWFAILGGLIRMFAPVSSQSGAAWVFVLLIVLLAIGIVLTFKAYGRGDAVGDLK
jgi:uncharacterized membrane protein YhaH (DUF805 family)